MISFFDRLENRAKQVDSLLCIGLDPHPQDLTSPTPDAALAFCLRLVETTADFVLAYKPNSAFFEAFGAEGISVLKKVIDSVPEGIPVILDAKRGDIASTSDAYARSAFNILGADAVTLSPYLGRDSLEPFLNSPEHGAFLLCRTSNPGAVDLQDLLVQPPSTQEEPGIFDPNRDLKLYEVVALLAKEWNRHGNLGLVVGATSSKDLARVRQLAPDLWILAPGVGAQGGDLHAALQAGLRSDGLGMVIPVSRAVTRVEDPRQAAKELRDKINNQREIIRGNLSRSSPRESSHCPVMLADALLEAGCVKFGQFTLKSGLVSPIYIDLRELVSFPSLLEKVAQAYLPILRGMVFDRIAALPYAALPIGAAISLKAGWPLIYPRKEVKTYGTKAEIEGIYHPGERVVVIDDLATTGGSKFEAIEKLTSAGLKVSDVVVLIDRQSGATESLAQAGVNLHAVLTLKQMLVHWEETGRVPPHQITAARNFLGL